MKPGLLLLILTLLVCSCSSFPDSDVDYMEYSDPELPENTAELAPEVIDWTVPDPILYFVHYISLPLEDLSFETVRYWPIPPVELTEVSDVTEIAETPSYQPPPVQQESPAEEYEAVPAEPPVVIEPEPLIVEEVIEQDPLSSEDNIRVFLEGGGWNWLVEREDGDSFRLKERLTSLEGVEFYFYPVIPGDYVLLFQKQDPRSGGLLQAEVRFSVKVFDQNLSDDDSSIERESPVGESKEELLEKMDILNEESDNPAEIIDILEKIISYQWDDEDYAGYLYRLALQYERNGVTQDLKRARDLHQQILDDFFLTSYYDKAESRIRYLNRHFFLLQ